MNTRLKVLVTFAVGALATAPAAAAVLSSGSACSPCTDGQTYQTVYRNVFQPQQVTAWRVEYQSVCEEQQVTTYRPVWETEMRDCSYTRVRYVQETCEREERYAVMRPVWETHERQESYTVLRPVQQTVYRTEYCTVNEPVTTYRTEYVDQGCYADQTVFKPSLPKTRLTWQSAGSVTDPVTGATVYRRPGLYWVQTPRGRYEVQRVWQPNVVARQVPQTTLVARTVARQIPVQVTSYQRERVCRTVPYQVCRMVRQECVRKVPYTVCRPVTERVERMVPVQVCRMVPVQETIRVPRCVKRCVPITYNCYVPRAVSCRVPSSSCLVPVECPTSCASAATYIEPATTVRQEPTAAGPQGGTGTADERPAIPPNERTPEPVDVDQAAPSSKVYGKQDGPST